MGGKIEFVGQHRRRAVLHACVGNLAPLAVVAATGWRAHSAVFLAGLLGACVAPLGVTLLSRRRRLPFYLAAYGGLPSLTLLQAGHGGIASDFTLLLMMPIVWFGLQARARELLVGLAVLASCCFAPMLVVGAPAYPVSPGHALLVVCVACVIAGMLHDLSVSTHDQAVRLRADAHVDALTGLLNRRGWEIRATEALAAARRAGLRAAIVAVDLDGLKEMNDLVGHEAGDRLLRATAERLRGGFRDGDVLARVGGDEFAVLVLGIEPLAALKVTQRLSDDASPMTAFSAGVASWDGEEDLEALLRRADAALYAAKAHGGHRVEVAAAG